MTVIEPRQDVRRRNSGGAVIHKLAVTAAVPGWGRLLRKLMKTARLISAFGGKKHDSPTPQGLRRGQVIRAIPDARLAKTFSEKGRSFF